MIDLLVQTSLNQLLFILIFFKSSYLNKAVNRIDSSPSVSTPCYSLYSDLRLGHQEVLQLYKARPKT
jgi:hypothetical protein